MSMMKKIDIDGKAVAFKASAAIPRIYRIKFQRDIYKDLSALEKAIGKDSGNSEDVSSLDPVSYTHLDVYKRQQGRLPVKDEWLCYSKTERMDECQ